LSRVIYAFVANRKPDLFELIESSLDSALSETSSILNLTGGERFVSMVECLIDGA